MTASPHVAAPAATIGRRVGAFAIDLGVAYGIAAVLVGVAVPVVFGVGATGDSASLARGRRPRLPRDRRCAARLVAGVLGHAGRPRFDRTARPRAPAAGRRLARPDRILARGLAQHRVRARGIDRRRLLLAAVRLQRSPPGLARHGVAVDGARHPGAATRRLASTRPHSRPRIRTWRRCARRPRRRCTRRRCPTSGSRPDRRRHRHRPAPPAVAGPAPATRPIAPIRPGVIDGVPWVTGDAPVTRAVQTDDFPNMTMPFPAATTTEPLAALFGAGAPAAPAPAPVAAPARPFASVASVVAPPAAPARPLASVVAPASVAFASSTDDLDETRLVRAAARAARRAVRRGSGARRPHLGRRDANGRVRAHALRPQPGERARRRLHPRAR